MARLDEQRRALAAAVRLNRAAENELTPQQARLFVRSLQTSWQVPPIAWGAQQSREQFADARRLLHAASIFRQVDGEDSPDALSCYRRAGELLEWLARSADAVTSDVPVAMLAAGAYQLAALPAMATALLRQGRFDVGTASIFASFLSADFDEVIARAIAFWGAHPEWTGRDGSAVLLAEEVPDTENDEPGIDADDRDMPAGEDYEAVAEAGKIGQWVTVELIRSLGLLSDGLRRGNAERTDRALAKLSNLSELSTRLSSDELWILVALIDAAARRYAADSIHKRVARLTERLPEKAPLMWRFAREQFARGRGILWASQLQGLDRLIAQDSFALCTPTGSGKTLVANLALVKELLLVPADLQTPLAIYLVPSRALAGEVEAKLTAEFGDRIVVTGLYGGADWGITDYWLTTDLPVVLIATVEKAEALMRYVGHLLIHRLRLLVIDEAHQVVNEGNANAMLALAAHNSRSMRLEAMISRILTLKPDVPRIALTAVAGGAAQPVATWIENDANAQPIGMGYRSSRQLIGALQCDPNRAPAAILDIMNGQMLYVRGRDDPVYLQLRIPQMQLPAAGIRNSLPHYTEIYVLWTALHLLEGGRRILISVMQSPERMMRRFADAFDLPGWEAIPPFVPPADAADRSRFDEARAACIDYCGIDSYERRLIDRGIATSHGQMPQRLRRLMTDLIDRRICPVTIATATLTEGVNLPFDIIFLTSLLRRGFDAQTGQQDIVPISTAEFRNLAGRAGRPGAADAIEGMTLVALPQAPSTTAQGSRPIQLTQIQRGERDYNNLLGRLLADDEAQGRVFSPLAVLITSIIQKCVRDLGLRTEPEILAWLEATLPENAGANLAIGSRVAGDQLGDTLDELDGFILAATEELALLEEAPLDGARLEERLRALWAHTFARVAAEQEQLLERLFLGRGRALVERLYPNAEQRRRLYQYGFTPYVGRRFERVAPDVINELTAAADYGALSAEQRFRLFERLGERVRAEAGVGFKERQTDGGQAILQNWAVIMAWWMQHAGAVPPQPDQLRAWQRFVTENLEFRLGVAVGAAVAQAWGLNAAALAIPTLDTWRATTGLPWIGFWFRELLRWGTLDPLVAFALAQGLAKTREEAVALRPEYGAWLAAQGQAMDAEALIDPQNFLAWQRSRAREAAPADAVLATVAQLTGVDGHHGRYDVRPLVRDGGIDWIDAAGFAVARSPYSQGLLTNWPARHDYELRTVPNVEVVRTF
jgi:hypothetical protein